MVLDAECVTASAKTTSTSFRPGVNGQFRRAELSARRRPGFR